MSLTLLVSAAVQAFRDAEDGLTLQELGAVIGTRWPERVYRAMVRDGCVFGEDGDRLVLVHAPGVDRGAGSSDSSPSGGLNLSSPSDGRGESDRTASAPVSTGSLFEVEPPKPQSPYAVDSEAA